MFGTGHRWRREFARAGGAPRRFMRLRQDGNCKSGGAAGPSLAEMFLDTVWYLAALKSRSWSRRKRSDRRMRSNFVSLSLSPECVLFCGGLSVVKQPLRGAKIKKNQSIF